MLYYYGSQPTKKGNFRARRRVQVPNCTFNIRPSSVRYLLSILFSVFFFFSYARTRTYTHTHNVLGYLRENITVGVLEKKKQKNISVISCPLLHLQAQDTQSHPGRSRERETENGCLQCTHNGTCNNTYNTVRTAAGRKRRVLRSSLFFFFPSSPSSSYTRCCWPHGNVINRYIVVATANRCRVIQVPYTVLEHNTLLADDYLSRCVFYSFIYPTLPLRARPWAKVHSCVGTIGAAIWWGSYTRKAICKKTLGRCNVFGRRTDVSLRRRETFVFQNIYFD